MTMALASADIDRKAVIIVPNISVCFQPGGLSKAQHHASAERQAQVTFHHAFQEQLDADKQSVSLAHLKHTL